MAHSVYVLQTLALEVEGILKRLQLLLSYGNIIVTVKIM